MKIFEYTIPFVIAVTLLIIALIIKLHHPYLSIFDAWIGGIMFAIAFYEYKQIK